MSRTFSDVSLSVSKLRRFEKIGAVNTFLTASKLDFRDFRDFKWYWPDFRDYADFEDLKYSNGFTPVFILRRF